MTIFSPLLNISDSLDGPNGHDLGTGQTGSGQNERGSSGPYLKQKTINVKNGEENRNSYSDKQEKQNFF